MQSSAVDIQIAVVAPTYNNAGTLRAIIEQLLALNLPVFVINDGSTDETATILEAMDSQIIRITHPHNRGKAAAIRTGFDAAISRSFTHVLTIDTDGQHDVADVPRLIEMAAKRPCDLIIGQRDLTDENYPHASRAGRVWSNRFVKLECGLSVSDSQSGLRIYPLSVMRLPASASRYGFETEILTRCGWANVHVVELPIRCIYQNDNGRVSHFRPWRDSLLAVVMHARLLSRSLLPWPPEKVVVANDHTTTGTLFQRILRWFSPRKAWRAIRSDEQERKRFAVAFALGVLIANLPVYGFQTVLSVISARRFRLNPLAVIAGSHLSTPPINAFLLCAAVIVGHWILNGRLLHWHDIYPPPEGYIALTQHMAGAFVLGSIVCGLSLAVFAYLLVQFILLIVPIKKEDHAISSDYVADT